MTMKNPNDMVAAVTASMKERTGRTVEEWVAVVNAAGLDPLDQNAVRRWLKSEHGVPMNSQYAIAQAAAFAAGWIEPTLEEYIDGQYQGAKAGLRPIFDRLRVIIEGFGDDVTLEGRSTYTPFVRGRQFAAIAAATKDRIDLGLRYRDPPVSTLLSEAKAPGQATHKVPLTSADEVTDEVVKLLRIAYEQG